MRHGQAEIMASTDALRGLTEYGQQQACRAGQWLALQHYLPDMIWASPYQRAQQTAIEVQKTLQQNTCVDKQEGVLAIKTISCLTPNDSATDVHDYIDAMLSVENYQQLLLVSHMPLVSYLLTSLSFDKTMMSFATAAIVIIDYDVKSMKGEVIAKYI